MSDVLLQGESMSPLAGVRIVYAGSLSPGRNAYARSRAFERLGAEVLPFDFELFGADNRFKGSWDYYTQFSLSQARLNRKFVQKVGGFQPDVVWVDKGLSLRKDAVEAARAASKKSQFLHYNPDDPFGNYSKGLGGFAWRTFIKAIEAYDIHLVARQENVSEFQEHGAARVETFDRSFDPLRHRPVNLNQEDHAKYATDIGFIGAYARERSKAIASLIKSGIKVSVIGNGWENTSDWHVIGPHWRGPSVYGDEYAKAICGMKIALHFLRRENRDDQDSRTFEIPACGSFMLAERSESHERLFEDGKEAVYFDGHADLKEKVIYFSENHEDRNTIAAAGYKRCVTSGYDHESRLNELLKRALS